MLVRCTKCGTEGNPAQGFCPKCGSAYQIDPQYFKERKIDPVIKVRAFLRNGIPLILIALFMLWVSLFFVAPNITAVLPEEGQRAKAEQKYLSFCQALTSSDSAIVREFIFSPAEINYMIQKSHVKNRQDEPFFVIDTQGNLLYIYAGNISVGNTISGHLRVTCAVDGDTKLEPLSARMGSLPVWGFSRSVLRTIAVAANENLLFLQLQKRLQRIELTEDGDIKIKLRK